VNCERYLCVKYNPGPPYGIHNKPSVRLTVGKPRLDAQEVAILLNINLPNELFKKPQLEANIRVPEENVNRPVINAEVLGNIEQHLKQTLGVELSISLIQPEDEL
jgi:hypothetical protein